VTTAALTAEQLVVEMQEVSATIHALENRRTELALALRAMGATWEQVGEAMGVSKQAAWERFAERN
jgi:hypothetical protein